MFYNEIVEELRSKRLHMLLRRRDSVSDLSLMYI